MVVLGLYVNLPGDVAGTINAGPSLNGKLRGDRERQSRLAL